MDLGRFPWFNDGDIRIAVLPDVYQLHSYVMRSCSDALDRLFQRCQVPDLPQETRSLESIRRLGLNLVGSAVHKFGMLESQGFDKHPQTMGEMAPGYFPVWSRKTRHVWCNMFKVFYDITPVLDNGGDENILDNCIELAELAEELEATRIVSQVLETALVGLGQRFFQFVAIDPVSWAKLGLRIRSVLLFQEAMIHLVGKWDILDDEDRFSLPGEIVELCTRKEERLTLAKKYIEIQLINYLPHSMRPATTINATEDAGNVYSWMAVAIFRQWLCKAISEGRNYLSVDGGATFYRSIAADGDGCMEILDLATINLSFPLDNEGMRQLEEKMVEVKQGTKHLVSKLLVNNSNYDPQVSGELPWLTCCNISEEDLPWEPVQSDDGSETQVGDNENFLYRAHTAVFPQMRDDAYQFYLAANDVEMEGLDPNLRTDFPATQEGPNWDFDANANGAITGAAASTLDHLGGISPARAAAIEAEQYIQKDETLAFL